MINTMSSLFNKLRFHIITFGCQMNKHDSERIVGMLEALGQTRVYSIEEADLVVFMTCCVREAADVRLHGQVASLKNIPLRSGSPLNKRIIAIGGCIGQRDGNALIEQQKHVNIVFGTHNLSSLPKLLEDVIENNEHAIELLEESEDFSTSLPTHREFPWSAWLPVATGCNNFCSYCIVPYVRGREKSRRQEDIIDDAKRYVADGVKEITLLGQNVNSYGTDLYGKPHFAELVRKLDSVGIKRLRFVTSHPKDLSQDLINCFSKCECLQPSLHLPVQSGSDTILKEMNRKYTRSHYLNLVEELRSACPSIALSTDIIVGFPGETEKDFLDTLSLVEQVGYTQVFTFIYSRREGTPAAKIPNNTPKHVIQNRFDRLVNVVQEQAWKANQVDLNTTVEILVEGLSKNDSTIITGKSPKNQTVHAPCNTMNPQDLVGNFVSVRIDQARTWYLRGNIIEGTVHA